MSSPRKGVSSLARQLGAYFKPAPAKRTDPHRKAREESKRLAAPLGVEIEKCRGDGFNVWPPADMMPADDPHDGDHYANDWTEVLAMVRIYADTMPNEAAEVDA